VIAPRKTATMLQPVAVENSGSGESAANIDHYIAKP
jgi:hypothetical protein